MELKPWPSEFRRKKRGEGCPQCEQGRVEETEHGVRFFEGAHADGYLQRTGPTLGYSVVVFRDRHVGDPQVSTVANALESAFSPIHLNLQILAMSADEHAAFWTDATRPRVSRCRPPHGKPVANSSSTM